MNQQQQQNVKKRGRTVKMKLLRETVDNVKKNKLIKQVKKLGKVDGFKVITQRKNDIVKYIVKQIRPPYKKKKSKKSGQEPPFKENTQIIFKNTVVSNRYGTRNQNVRERNAQNTGWSDRSGYPTTVAS
jgi:hypothetical protein